MTDYEDCVITVSKSGVRRALRGNEHMIADALEVLVNHGALLIRFSPPHGLSKHRLVRIYGVRRV